MPMQAQWGGGDIATTHRSLGARRGWVESNTPRPLYPPEGTCTHGTRGWVGFGAGLDGHGKSRPHRDSIRGPSSP